MLAEHCDKKEKEALDRSLASLDPQGARAGNSRMVDVVKNDGTTVRISEARLAELKANATNIRHMGKR